jgi:hypothetical protein
MGKKLLLFIIVGIFLISNAFALTLYENNRPSLNDYWSYGNTSSIDLDGMQFLAQSDYTFKQLQIRTFRPVGAMNCIYCLTDDNSDTIGNDLSCNYATDVSGIGSDTGGYLFNITIPDYDVVNGTKYWVVTHGCDIDYMRWNGVGDSGYGSLYTYIEGAGGYSTASRSFYFDNYGDPISPPPTPNYTKVDITYPLNWQNYSYNVTSMNFTITSNLNMSNCWYSLDRGLTNTTTDCSLNITGIGSRLGQNNWSVYANDTTGFTNSSIITFNYAQNILILNITYPLNWQNYSYNVTSMNFTSSGYQSCWYSLNDGIANTTTNCSLNITGIGSALGQNNWSVYANDSLGNLNYSRVSFNYIPTPISIIPSYTNIGAGIYSNKINYTGVGNTYYLSSDTRKGGQTFTVLNGDFYISQVSFRFAGFSAIGITNVSVFATNSSGLPIGNPLTQNSTFNVANVNPLIFSWYNVSIPSYELINGTKYAVTIDYIQSGSLTFEVLAISSTYAYGDFIDNPFGTWFIPVANTSAFFQVWDTTGHLAVVIPAVNNTYFNVNNLNLTANVSSIYGLQNITITVKNQSGSEVGKSTITFIGSILKYLFGFPIILVDGVYNWFAEAIDVTSNYLLSDIFTFTIDTLPAGVNILYPLADEKYNYKPFELNYTLVEINPDSCWYSLDNGTTETPITCGDNVTGILADEGINIWVVYANDSSGNINSSSITFIAKTIMPPIEFIPPTEPNGANLSKNNISIAVSTTDLYPSNLTINLFNSTGFYNSSFGTKNILASTCYQETANVSTPCGGLSTGNYLGTINWNYGVNQGFDKVIDGDWNTFGNAQNLQDSYLYINYAKPPFSLSSSLWQVKGEGIFQNLTLLDSCWNYNPVFISLSVQSHTFPTGENRWYCLNATGWQQLAMQSGGNYQRVYEEAMTWNVSTATYLISNFPANDGVYYFNATVYDVVNNFNSTETRTVTIDTIKPVLALISPQPYTNYSTHDTPINITLNFTASDTSLQSCFYSLDNINGTRITIPCNIAQMITYALGGTKTIWYGANDSFGNEAVNNTIFTINYITTNVSTASPSVVEGQTVNFNLEVNMPVLSNTIASLVYNEISYPSDSYAIINNSYIFLKSLTIPAGTGNITGKLVNWYWSYRIDAYSNVTNTSLQNQTVYSVAFDDCSVFNDTILYMKLHDENNNIIIPINESPQIQVQVNLLSLNDSSISWQFSNTYYSNNASVCVPSYLLNYTSYYIDVIASYQANNYATEFWYLDNGLLQYQNQTLDAFTQRNVTLMDLLLSDSTTFLFIFYDSNYLQQPNAIVTVLRDYIGNGQFREVERAKQDNNGETHIHLVQEDVIYEFRVTLDGVLLYTSSDYNAKCLTQPCSVTLQQPLPSLSDIYYNNLPEGTYNLSEDANTRTVSLAFNLKSTNTMNLTIYEYTDGNPTPHPIASGSSTAKSGIITVAIPISYGNETYVAYVRMNNVFVASEGINWEENAFGYFGTLGILLAGLLILCLGLISISHGGWTIIFVLVGLLIAIVTKLFQMDYTTYIFIVCAGFILVWKLATRRSI